MSARRPRRTLVKVPPIEVRAEIVAPTIVLSRRAGRFEAREVIMPGVEPTDLESMLDRPTRTGRVDRQLGRLYLYLRELAAGRIAGEAFFGVGVFVDVPGHPWNAFCDVDASGRPVALNPAMHAQVTACVQAFGTARPGRHARGKQAPPTRAEHFRKLAVTLGLVSPRSEAESVRQMAKAGRRVLDSPK